MLCFRDNKCKDAFFFRKKIFFNQFFNQFIVCMCTAWCTRLKHNKRVAISEETEFLTNFLNIAFSEKWLQILKIVQSVKLRPNHASFWTWTTRLYPTRQVKSILQPEIPPISHTSGLGAKIRSFNNTIFICKKIFPKMLSRACIDNSKALITLKLSDWSFWLHSCALTFSHCSQCRLHFWSDCNKISDAFEPYISEFGNIFGNIFFSWIPCYWNFQILLSKRKCAKWVEISGCKMEWTCS